MYIEKPKCGICDSEKAKVHDSQVMFFEKNAEAERIVEFFNAHYGFHMTLGWKKQTTCRMGCCYYQSQEIVLYVGGDSVATLLHEIAHVVDWVRNRHAGHGILFHKAQDEVIDIFDIYTHKMILDAKPTLTYHAAQVIDSAKSTGRELEDIIYGYALIEKVDTDALLDAVVERL